MQKKVLIVDDQVAFLNQIKEAFRDEDFSLDVSSSAEDALERIAETNINLLVTDLKMPLMDGKELLKRVKEKQNQMPVIVMTAYGSIESAVELIKMGAVDYITKPFSPEELSHVIRQELEKQRLKEKVALLEKEVKERYKFGNIIGKNHKMLEIFDLIDNISDTDATVLISGETGTGKELLAKSIHYNSARKNKPFVKISCGALSETLLESELFGHEKGSFTGAVGQKIGKFEYANGGTVFIDEVSDMSPSMQLKLLRVLQEKEFERVGGNETIRVDIKIIAATNKKLEQEILAGNFREDLYFRLNVINIKIPPLRDRLDDVPFLAQHFLMKYRERFKRDIKVISQKALNKMLMNNWPGNVRELENAIERAVILSKGDTIEDIALTDFLKNGSEYRSIYHNGASLKEERDRIIREFEKNYLINSLTEHRGNISRASKAAGIDIKSFRIKMQKYHLKKEDYKGRSKSQKMTLRPK